MRLLPKGANAPLAQSGKVRVELVWEAHRGAPNAVCFAVDAAGRVPDDDWLVFRGRDQSPKGAIRLVLDTSDRAAFVVALDALPANVQRCVFAATLESGRFGDLRGTLLAAGTGSGESLGFRLEEASDEQALIFAEIYRHQSAWKLRAIGQGFTGGLYPLAAHFGAKLAPSSGNHVAPTEAPAASDAGTGRGRPAKAPSGKRWLGRLLLVGFVLAAAASVWFLKPEWRAAPERIWPDIQGFFTEVRFFDWIPWGRLEGTFRLPSSAVQPLGCDWGDEEVFERYHRLGENYVQILGRVDQSNDLLAAFRGQISQLHGACPEVLHRHSQREIEELKTQPVETWLKEATALNACAGLMIKALESRLAAESRPIILQRLLREADRARNLESDLTNIARDLAYLRNKSERLIAGFGEVLDACPQ